MLLLNAAFMTTYQFGILIEFADQITRRVFPRLFAYMADYPEKYIPYPFLMFSLYLPMCYFNRILMAGIRNMGLCPCPRCLIKKTDLSALGTQRDNRQRAKIRVNNHHFRTKVSLAREIIYKHGLRVNTDAVNNLLKKESLVPTTVCSQTCFSRFYLKLLSECIPHHICQLWFQHFYAICCGPNA
jgi:hypothetical protein